MNDLSIIRNDLKEIRYYYSRKTTFDEALDGFGKSNEIINKIRKYDGVMAKAPPRLYDIYYSLYIKNHTQESLANELGFTTEYIQKLNQQLIKFIRNALDKEITL